MARAYFLRNKEKYTEYMRKARREVLAFFGNKCTRCGFDDWRALNVDHIIPCLSKGRMNSTTLRAYIHKNPEEAKKKFQCLCANCNQIKTHENNERRGAHTRNGVQIGRTDMVRTGEEVLECQPVA